MRPPTIVMSAVMPQIGELARLDRALQVFLERQISPRERGGAQRLLAREALRRRDDLVGGARDAGDRLKWAVFTGTHGTT